MKKAHKFILALSTLVLAGCSESFHYTLSRFYDSNQNGLYDSQNIEEHEVIRNEEGAIKDYLRKVVRGNLAQERTKEQLEKEMKKSLTKLFVFE